MGLERLFSKVALGFSRFKIALGLVEKERNPDSLRRLADGYNDFYESRDCYKKEVVPKMDKLRDNLPERLKMGWPRLRSDVESTIELKRLRNVKNYIGCINTTKAERERGIIDNGEYFNTMWHYVEKLRCVDDGANAGFIAEVEKELSVYSLR